ncbi:hypothetical protein KUTeg_010681 [Tegillarca granosa]|uniref:C2H2-type domain-containing protein n=1 Tax=Tegillarca granosa TaxID=220873 RepID=A0ABQ9F424_TEGGR|nr:hypothetical protein KUTeg_010681 [Tegillarca granosa]
MADNVYNMFDNGCDEQNGIMKQRNNGKQNGGYASDSRDENTSCSETSHQTETYSECGRYDSCCDESQKGQQCETKDFEKIDLPCLKRRIWSPNKSSSGKNKLSSDNCVVFTENSEDFENQSNSESEYEPKKRRRKQLHSDKNMVYPFWGDTHQPFIEFDNTRMFLKFRKEQNTFRCTECDIVFSSESDLITHMVSHDAEISDKQEVTKEDKLKNDNKNDIPLTVIKYETKTGLSGEDLLRMHKEAENKMTRCQYCNVTFPSKKGVEKHISFKHKDKLAETGQGPNEPLVCVLCGKILKTKYSLKKHWQVHSESKDFKCTICDKGFAYRRSLEMHVKGHEYAKQYETQGHVGGENHNLTNHSKKETFKIAEGNRLKIDLNENSGKIMDKSTDSDVYITRCDEDGKKVFQCVSCMKTFDSEPFVIEHAGNGCTLKKNKPQKCPICNKILKTSVADHIRIHTGERPYECPICGKMFKRGYHLQIHQQTAHSDDKPWHCDEPGCGKSFKRKDKLQCHKRTHSTEKPYICLDCGNSYKQSHHLSRHRRRMHDNTKYSLKKHWQVHSESKDFKCTICDKGFAYRRSLEMHVKGHEYAKQYETQGHVGGENHNLTNHSKKETFKIAEGNRLKIDLNENSGKIMDKSTDSDVYITRCDEDGKKVFQCVSCMKTFDSEPFVIEHAGNGCTLKKNKPQKCPICNKILKTSVADHIRIHTAHSDDKPWHCDEPGCGKSFKRKDKLQCHKRTHSTEKPYICLDCGNSYKQSHHLSRHRRRMHDNVETKTKMENVEEEIRNELVCVDFNGMEQFIREAYDNDDKTAKMKGNDFKNDSNESWDMSKQIAETISNISEKDDS